MAKVFESLHPEELYWRDEVTRFQGAQAIEQTPYGPSASLIVDEKVDIDDYVAATKAILDREASGFRDSVEVMKFIVGRTDLPAMIDFGPEGDVRELAPV